MSDQEQEVKINNALTRVVPKILGFAGTVQKLALRFKGLARFLALSGLLSALIIDIALIRSFGLSTTAGIVIGAILVFPGFVLSWLWYTLESAISLPQRLSSWLKDAGQYAVGMKAKISTKDQTSEVKNFSDLKGLGGLTYDIASMGLDAKDVVELLGGTLMLTNPITLIVITVSSITIVILDLGSLITGLVTIF